VFPRARRQIRSWQTRAEQIPDPALRASALDAQRTDNANVEGAAAFAALAPRSRRPSVVRANVVFQTLSDYLDTLSEQASENPIANGRQLHQALLAALDGDAPDVDYYAFHPHRGDGGYLSELVQGCRTALAALPSYPKVAHLARSLGEHGVRFQSLNLPDRAGGHGRLADWVRSGAAPGSKLYWWETAAAADSTLGIHALFSTAARPTLGLQDVVAIRDAYVPWVETLSTLLDSVVDESDDLARGQPSFLHYYSSTSEAASRISLIATEAIRSVSALPNAATHAAILTGMVGSYISRMPPTPAGTLVSRAVLAAMGFLAKPTVFMFRVRRAAGAAGVFAASAQPRLRSGSDAATAVMSKGSIRTGREACAR
jgi:tetraprenyl-beta-curcumene synthase